MEKTTEKMNLTIEDFEDKKAQTGKRYTRFKTDQGWMSAFDAKTIEALKECEGKEVCCEIAIDEEKGFKNIRKFLGEPQKSENKASVKEDAPRARESPASMWASYAKDVFLHLQSPGTDANATKNMETAIGLIKQAKTAFE